MIEKIYHKEVKERIFQKDVVIQFNSSLQLYYLNANARTTQEGLVN